MSATPSWITTSRQQIARRLPDRCAISNVPGDTAFERTGVPCRVTALAPRTALVEDGAGGIVEQVLQRWEVLVVGGQALPNGKAQIVVTVEGVEHTFQTTTRVPRGQSEEITITMECEEIFGG